MQEHEIIRVLLVDDEPNILTALEFLIQKEGFEVHKSINGEDALAMMEKYKPRIVVLDVMMPRMNGYDVAKRIRSNSAYDHTQIIFLTARGTQDDRFEGYGSGAEIYLTKPFDNEELVNTIKELVEYG
ncbi:MAG: response regulator transcription factor [Saprospiraceae bacterium]